MADKPLVWLHGEIKTPPFSDQGRGEVGFLLRQLQRGESLGMPRSRPMPSVGPRCHELRVADPVADVNWRVLYRIDPQAIVVADIFAKKAAQTPKNVIEACQARLAVFDRNKE